ncbi:MAG: DNA-3-methyladenine glycosylase I [Methylophilaceae bacterium]|nr:MAG: DNA-3-methyladenine glycosylase I [Methylophilaceae bacterium]
MTVNRCEWANASALEAQYHDEEWGMPLHDDRLLFESLILESAQSGLSWATILRKREGYRQAFDHFDVQKVSKYSEEKIQTLLQNPAIVRNKLKVNATVINAQRIIAIQAEYGSFNQYIWSFVSGKPINKQWEALSDVPATTAESEAMSKALKQKGFKFIGPTTCYAFMQAIGMVNDHVVSCFRHSEC